MSNEMETRTVNAPRTGTKVSLIVAAASLAVAVYYYVSSTHFTGKDGGLFGCGSPLSPNNAALGKDQCHIVESESLHKALLFLALGLISAILGTLLFGMEKSVQGRRSRSRLDDEDEAHDDRAEHYDEHTGGRRSRLLSGREERRAEPRHGRESSTPRRPRLGDEDELEAEPRRNRFAAADDADRGSRDDRDDDATPTERRSRRGASRRLGDEDDRDEPRRSDDLGERREERPVRRSRYDADAFEDSKD